MTLPASMLVPRQRTAWRVWSKAKTLPDCSLLHGALAQSAFVRWRNTELSHQHHARSTPACNQFEAPSYRPASCWFAADLPPRKFDQRACEGPCGEARQAEGLWLFYSILHDRLSLVLKCRPARITAFGITFKEIKRSKVTKMTNSIHPAFDANTAKLFEKNVAGSRHNAYRDAHGNICLTCISTTENGGVAMNEAAFNGFKEQQGDKFVRLINQAGKFDITVPLSELPKSFREGRHGRYCFYDADDFRDGPEFPPPNDYTTVM